MSATATLVPMAPVGERCDDKYPVKTRTRCTRYAGHQGGHLHHPGGEYWPADIIPAPAAPAPVQAGRPVPCTECGTPIPPLAYGNGFRCCAPAVRA